MEEYESNCFGKRDYVYLYLFNTVTNASSQFHTKNSEKQNEKIEKLYVFLYTPLIWIRYVSAFFSHVSQCGWCIHTMKIKVNIKTACVLKIKILPLLKSSLCDDAQVCVMMYSSEA